MDIVEKTLERDLDSFLQEPLVCFLATTSVEDAPRISPLWFLWEDEAIWIIADTEGKEYAHRAVRQDECALAIVDYAIEVGRFHHVGVRGQAELRPMDQDRADRLLARYLGPNASDWPSRFTDLDPSRWAFLRVEPETVVMRDQSFEPSL